MLITKTAGKKIGLGNFGETTSKLYKIYKENFLNPVRVFLWNKF